MNEVYDICFSVYTERWFRLRGNLLFYFKTKDKVCETLRHLLLFTLVKGARSQGFCCFTVGQFCAKIIT